jgi:hypothetical protein
MRPSVAMAVHKPCWATCRPMPELYDLIGLHDYEMLDASIVRTIVPGRISQQ